MSTEICCKSTVQEYLKAKPYNFIFHAFQSRAHVPYAMHIASRRPKLHKNQPTLRLQTLQTTHTITSRPLRNSADSICDLSFFPSFFIAVSLRGVQYNCHAQYKSQRHEHSFALIVHEREGLLRCKLCASFYARQRVCPSPREVIKYEERKKECVFTTQVLQSARDRTTLTPSLPPRIERTSCTGRNAHERSRRTIPSLPVLHRTCCGQPLLNLLPELTSPFRCSDKLRGISFFLSLLIYHYVQ